MRTLSTAYLLELEPAPLVPELLSDAPELELPMPGLAEPEAPLELPLEDAPEEAAGESDFFFDCCFFLSFSLVSPEAPLVASSERLVLLAEGVDESDDEAPEVAPLVLGVAEVLDVSDAPEALDDIPEEPLVAPVLEGEDDLLLPVAVSAPLVL